MKKSFICLGLLLFLGLIYTVHSSYGLYEDNFQKEANMEVASFKLNINDSNIDNTNQEFLINSLTYFGNNNTNPSKLGPGSREYFDIRVNPEDIDVSIRLDITFDLSGFNDTPIILESVRNETKSTNLVRTDEFVYSGIVSINDVKNDRINVIRNTFYWENNDSNNENDMTSSLLNSVSVPISVHISQYLGEEISEYTPVIDE